MRARTAWILIFTLVFFAPAAWAGTFEQYAHCIERETGTVWSVACASSALLCVKAWKPWVKSMACARTLVCGAVDMGILIGCLGVYIDDPAQIRGQVLSADRIQVTNTRKTQDIFYVSADYVAALGEGSPSEPSWGWKPLQVREVEGGEAGAQSAQGPLEVVIEAGKTATITYSIPEKVTSGRFLFSAITFKSALEPAGEVEGQPRLERFKATGIWIEEIPAGSG